MDDQRVSRSEPLPHSRTIMLTTYLGNLFSLVLIGQLLLVLSFSLCALWHMTMKAEPDIGQNDDEAVFQRFHHCEEDVAEAPGGDILVAELEAAEAEDPGAVLVAEQAATEAPSQT